MSSNPALRGLCFAAMLAMAGCTNVAIPALPGDDGGAVDDTPTLPGEDAGGGGGGRVDSAGPPIDTGGGGGGGSCRSNADCGAQAFCSGNGCGTPGTCMQRPQGCTLEYAPVCGCDGRTYGNLCAAASSGVRAASRGECGGGGVDAGTPPPTCAAVLCMVGQVCCEALGARCVPPGQCGGSTDAGVPPITCANVRCAAGTECCEAGGAPRCVPTGQCSGTGACASARDCGSNQECVYPESACARSGRCTAAIQCLRPETFCSCTGVTYLACRPDRSTLARGACGSTADAGVPDAGPPACRSNADCPGGWCAGNGCGTAGTCATRPQACADIYRPVCGCDGRTYGNECEAMSNGVRVASTGQCGGVDSGVPPVTCAVVLCQAGTVCCMAGGSARCVPPGQCPTTVDAGAPDTGTPRGCTSRDGCGANQECVFPTNQCVREGQCMSQIFCLRPETFCSCAGETFMGCRPDRPTQSLGACNTTPDAGVSRCATVRCSAGFACCESTGQCYDTRCLECCRPVLSGCRSNADCASGQYCAGSGCNTTGTCATRPQACNTLYSPVCGCDGRTYGNECTAHSAGQRVASTGACRGG